MLLPFARFSISFYGKQVVIRYPLIADQWHPTLNGDISPYDIKPNTKVKYYWLLPYDGEKTGKHFDFIWKASPNERVNGNGCPYLTGKAIWIGYNDLEHTRPLLALEWHPWRNGDLKPADVTRGKRLKVWWYLPCDDPVLGYFDFEWEAKAVNRTLLGEGCPYIGNDKVWKGYNDLLSRMPHIAREWHSTKNRRLRPDGVYKESTRKVWWKCSQYGYEWFGSIRGRTVNGIGCKKCQRNNPFIL